MFFSKKKRTKTQPISKNPAVFEKVFTDRVGRDPVTYILDKIASGTDTNSIRYIFDIMSAEIEIRNHCKSPGFDHYYNAALAKNSPIPPIHTPVSVPTRTPTRIPTQTPTQISYEFVVSQLIGKSRFLAQYKAQLKSLAADQTFWKFIEILRTELDGKELTDTPAANKYIANYFHSNKASTKFPEVSTIVNGVLNYGKPSSAYISIYYAMFLSRNPFF